MYDFIFLNGEQEELILCSLACCPSPPVFQEGAGGNTVLHKLTLKFFSFNYVIFYHCSHLTFLNPFHIHEVFYIYEQVEALVKPEPPSGLELL